MLTRTPEGVSQGDYLDWELPVSYIADPLGNLVLAHADGRQTLVRPNGSSQDLTAVAPSESEVL